MAQEWMGGTWEGATSLGAKNVSGPSSPVHRYAGLWDAAQPTHAHSHSLTCTCPRILLVLLHHVRAPSFRKFSLGTRDSTSVPTSEGSQVAIHGTEKTKSRAQRASRKT